MPADGSYQVLARVFDNAGNSRDSTKQTVTIDNTAPAMTAMVDAGHRQRRQDRPGRRDLQRDAGHLHRRHCAVDADQRAVRRHARARSRSSGTTATLTITEGSGAKDTAVGSFTVALATSATGIRDAVGNQSSFAATAPTDDAKPVPVTVSLNNKSGSTARQGRGGRLRHDHVLRAAERRVALHDVVERRQRPEPSARSPPR